jgi:hypothetical protein
VGVWSDVVGVGSNVLGAGSGVLGVDNHVTYREQDDRHAREQAAIDREVAEAEAREIDRARLAMKDGAVVTPGMRRLGRWLVRVGVMLFVVTAIGTLYVMLRRPVRWRLGLCDQGTMRCASEDRADVCFGGHAHTMRCKGGCNPPYDCTPMDDPEPGEALALGASPTGAPISELGTCSADHRSWLACEGDFDACIWKTAKVCAPDEVCDSPRVGGFMGKDGPCKKKRPLPP